MEELYAAGRIKAIGVSNFQIHHLEDLMQDAKVKPMINQVEYHPRLTQVELKAFCEKHGIPKQGQLLDNPVLTAIASAKGKSVAQVILRWDLQNGVITIPKSTKEHRIIENSSIFDFELSNEEMDQISALNEDVRVGPDPDNFDF
ncbi:hypothetical protein HK101_004514 [Irineochytrium annulatum]|nr:hypothetical protein HK101_004514 [Irineochytrium annulatum]